MTFPPSAEYTPGLTWAFMFYPRDQTARENYLNGIEKSLPGIAFAAGMSDLANLTDQDRRNIALGPRIDDTLRRFVANVEEYGFISGYILYYVLSLASHAPELASVSKAIDLFRYKMHQKGKAPSREHLFRKWSEYKSVSHFYTALLVDPSPLKRSAERLDNMFIDLHAPEPTLRPEALVELAQSANDPTKYAEILLLEETLHWLAIAEAIRRQACRTYPLAQPGRKMTILDDEETWTVPPQIKLPKVEFSLLPLSQESMDFLLGKKNRALAN